MSNENLITFNLTTYKKKEKEKKTLTPKKRNR